MKCVSLALAAAMMLATPPATAQQTRTVTDDLGGVAQSLGELCQPITLSRHGTAAGRRLRDSTGTTEKALAMRIAAETVVIAWKCHLDGPSALMDRART